MKKQNKTKQNRQTNKQTKTSKDFGPGTFNITQFQSVLMGVVPAEY